ncbi:MAG: hypothetical protein ACYDHY_07655 [Acidiferrobacterales bacterium]
MAQKGQITPVETRMKQRMALLGRKRPPEIGRAVSKALKGIIRPPEFCEATSEGLRASYERRGIASSTDKKVFIRRARGPLHRARCAIMKGDASEKRTRMLGYSEVELKEHLEKLFSPGMSWENYGQWVIDHVKSIVLFPIGTDIKVLNALSNLQPLWKHDNAKKNRGGM